MLSREERVESYEKQLQHGNAVLPHLASIGDDVLMRVVACAGDPGVSEPWFFDILSRFIICMKEPVSHVPTNSKMFKQFFLVKRPRHLWVDSSGAPDVTEGYFHAGTRRKDYLGNVNIGHPNGYSVNTIPLMDTEYSVGDLISARKVKAEYATNSNIFISAFENGDFDQYYANVDSVNVGGKRTGKNSVMGGSYLEEVMSWSNDYWTSHGGGLSREQLQAANRMNHDFFQLKPLMPAAARYGAPVKPPRAEDTSLNVKGNRRGQVTSTPGPRTVGTPTANMYWMILHYYRIDGAMREFHPASSGTIDKLQKGVHRYQTDGIGQNALGQPKQGKQLFGMVLGEVKDSGGAVMATEIVGDHSFINQNIPFGLVEWEDTNQANRQRTNRDDCMPLVIASPNNFPIPKERKIGSILYSPAYSTVVAAQNP